MKSFFRLTLLFAAFALLFSSCGKKSNDEGKMIPKNAMFVLHLNTKSLRSKLTWDDIKSTFWYGKLLSHIQENHHLTADQVKLISNPETSGIDLDGGLVLFVVKNSGSDGEAVVEGLVKNESDFAQFNKNFDSSAAIQKDGDLNILSVKNAGVVVWNSKNFVYAFDANKAKYMHGMQNDESDTNSVSLVEKNVTLITSCKNLFTLKSDSSLANNEKFSTLMHDNGDIHAWINSEEIMKSNTSLGMLGMLKLDVFLKDNVSAYTINFDNGKISINHKGYVGKDFGDLLRKYSGNGINTDMIKSIPSQNVTGFFALNYKPEGIKELIKLTGLDGFLNMYTDKMGFNLDDFVKANKGDLMLSFSDFAINKTTPDTLNPMGNSKPDFNILFSVSIGDKPSFQKLIDAGKKIGSEMGRNDTSISFGQNDKVFAITNHQHFLNDYLAAKSDNKFDFTDKLSGHAMGFFVDIHKILSVAVASEKSTNGDDSTILNESLKLWNNISSAGGDFKDDAITGSAEINFIDQTTNSLKQLNHYFDAIAKVQIEKKERNQMPDMSTVDTTAIPPPPLDSAAHK